MGVEIFPDIFNTSFIRRRKSAAFRSSCLLSGVCCLKSSARAKNLPRRATTARQASLRSFVTGGICSERSLSVTKRGVNDFVPEMEEGVGMFRAIVSTHATTCRPEEDDGDSNKSASILLMQRGDTYEKSSPPDTQTCQASQ